MSEWAGELELARTAAREAGAAVMKWFGSDLEVRHKSPGQPLTAADLEADRLLHDRLLADHHAYGWLSEETVDGPDRLERDRVWIVDPIDGTRSFIAGRPEFTISVGLAERGRPVVGVVYNPARDELFSAVAGGGAFVELHGGAAQPLKLGGFATGRTARLLASRSEIGAGEFAGFPGGWTVEPAGSTAYKLACVAWGRADAFVSRGPKSEWDVCAGVLLVEEAGGRATDQTGAVPQFNCADPYVHGMIASSVAAHGGLLDAVRAMPERRRQERGRQ